MTESDSKQTYSALNDVLWHWRSGGVPGIARTDIQRLERLIESDTLCDLWAVVPKNRARLAAEVATKMLLQKLFEAANHIPEWDSKTGTERRRKLNQGEAAANKLVNLLADTPIRYLSEGALDKMGLTPLPFRDIPGVRRVDDPDFLTALEDLRNQVATRLLDEPVLRRKSGEDTHRTYFVIFVARYLSQMFGIQSNALVAELAKIMLRDEDIDAETVRKTRGAKTTN